MAPQKRGRGRLVPKKPGFWPQKTPKNPKTPDRYRLGPPATEGRWAGFLVKNGRYIR